MEREYEQQLITDAWEQMRTARACIADVKRLIAASKAEMERSREAVARSCALRARNNTLEAACRSR